MKNISSSIAEYISAKNQVEWLDSKNFAQDATKASIELSELHSSLVAEISEDIFSEYEEGRNLIAQIVGLCETLNFVKVKVDRQSVNIYTSELGSDYIEFTWSDEMKKFVQPNGYSYVSVSLGSIPTDWSEEALENFKKNKPFSSELEEVALKLGKKVEYMVTGSYHEKFWVAKMVD